MESDNFTALKLTQIFLKNLTLLYVKVENLT
jgi:hypothetical protein